MKLKERNYRGKYYSELINLSDLDLSKYLSARARRSIIRGLSKLHVKKRKEILNSEGVKLRSRSFLFFPDMVGKTVLIYNGKNYKPYKICQEAIGHYSGEFVLTRKKLKHGKAGQGSTKGSKFVPLK